MTTLALYVLSLVLTGFSPGRTSFSMMPAPSCSEEAPCIPSPVWVEGIGWAQVETREAGAERLEVVAQALADAAEARGDKWPGGSTDLARAMVSAVGWSTGFREDIQVGRKRGSAGEICLADMQIPTLRLFAAPELRKLPEVELVRAVSGRDYLELRRCLDAAAVGLTHSRWYAGWHCKRELIPMEQAAFAVYGTGLRCRTGGRLWWAEHRRYATLSKYRARTTTVFPDWYTPQ